MKGGEDECAIASNTYDCGMEKLPDITKKMIDKAEGNTTVVRKHVSLYMRANYNFSQYIPPLDCLPRRYCFTDSWPCVKNVINIFFKCK